MKRLFALTLLISWLGVHVTSAQELKLVEFDSTSFDKGKVEEVKFPKVDYTFKFRNIYDGPVQIIDAKASCGCTTPGWEKEIIRKAGEGYVMAAYDTKNRPGKYEKSVTVRVAKIDLQTQKPDTTAVQTIVLRIKGEVIPKPKTALDAYRFEDGNLRYTTNNFSFGTVARKGTITRNVTIYNAGKKGITIQKVEAKPVVSIKFKDDRKMIPPKDSLQATVSYHLDQVNDYEWQNERIQLHTDDDSIPLKRWYLNATVLPDFSHLNPADSATFPKMVVLPASLDMGKVKAGEKVSGKFTIENKGKTPLEIYKVRTSGTNMTYELPKTKIAPGEKVDIKLTFDTQGKKGEQFKTLKFVSNDPKLPYLTLGVQVNVVE
jgi:hypothetical protein